MNKTKLLAGISLGLNLVLLAALALALVYIARTHTAGVQNSADTLLPQQQEDAAEVMGAGEEQQNAELDAWIGNMKGLAQKHNVDAYFLQELFPENIVYKHRGQIVYAEVDDSLPQHSYDWAHLQADEEGILRYSQPGGLQGIFGIDVSKYQGHIDWDKVKEAGVGFVIIRVGYRGYGSGDIMLDEYFESYIEGATKAGLPVGVYFFSQAITTQEAVEEAEFVLEAVEGYELAYPVVFDMEDLSGEAAEYRAQHLAAAEVTDIALAFCQRVQQAGHRPMVYGNVAWLLAMMELHRLADIDIWFAQYRPMPYWPYQMAMWQYTHRGTVPGIAGDVDLNISFVDYTAQ